MARRVCIHEPAVTLQQFTIASSFVICALYITEPPA
jgi:hypothetical protein